MMVGCEKGIVPAVPKRRAKQEILIHSHFHRLFRVAALYTLAKNEYSTLTAQYTGEPNDCNGNRA